VDDREYEVVIVGAGPVGLSLALELGKRGVDVCLVERRGVGCVIRRPPGSMFVQWRSSVSTGIAEGIRTVGNLPLETWGGFGYMTRINAADFGAIDLFSDPYRPSRPAPPPRADHVVRSGQPGALPA